MNWSRCSKSLALGLVLLVAVVAPAVAVTAQVDAPAESKVGTKVSGTVTLTDLYEDGTQEWTLVGTTNATGAQWVVKKTTLGGDVTTKSYTGQRFETTVSSANNVEKVTVKVTGTTPKVSNFTYRPAETFTLAQLNKTAGQSSTVLTAPEVHHFTEKSKQARTQIQQAQQAVNESDSTQAKKTLQNAISAYNAGNFANAIDLANQAEQTAKQAQQSQARTKLLLYGAIGVVALLLVGGGVYYWRSQQSSYDKLR